MSEELYFSDELRKCLNSAGLSDCGENDAWNYWYQRVRKAHDQAVDKVTEVQRAENAKLRELADAVKEFVEDTNCEDCPFRRDCDDNNRIFCASDFSYHAFAAMRELGVEV